MDAERACCDGGGGRGKGAAEGAYRRLAGAGDVNRSDPVRHLLLRRRGVAGDRWACAAAPRRAAASWAHPDRVQRLPGAGVGRGSGGDVDPLSAPRVGAR